MSTFGKIGARPLLLKNTGEYAEEQMYKELFEKTASRTFTENTDLYFTTPTIIGQAAFSHCTFRNIILPNVTSMGQEAIAYSTMYGDTISLPNLTEVTGLYALRAIQNFGHVVGTGSILTVSVPKLTILTNALFYGAFQRTSGTMRPAIVNAESATEISGTTFYNCGGIQRLYAPRVTSVSGVSVFLRISPFYCQDNRNTHTGECSIILGSAELGTGMTMDALTSSTDFPFGVGIYGSYPTFYCKDGTVTYDTTTSTWVQNSYT